MAPLRLLVFFLLTLPGFADQGYHATIRFGQIPPGARPVTAAADAAGNLYIVSNITTPSGLPQIRVDKIDPNGNSLGSIEFGGTYQSQGFVPSFFYAQDSVVGAAVDPSGNLVIAGTTFASDFPLVSPLFTTNKLGSSGLLGSSGFVTKLDPQLKNILFSTALGGKQGSTSAGALTLDKAGNIYVTGDTWDTDFPVTQGAFQSQLQPGAEYAFVTEIAANDKSIVFSTYFGDPAVSCAASSYMCPGFAFTEGSAIVSDSEGNVIIGGNTVANHLPITVGAFAANCGDCGISASGFEDLAGFLAKFSTDGSKLLAASYVPVVASSSYCTSVLTAALTVDANGNVIVAGTTSSVLSLTSGALQTSFPESAGASGSAGFVMKFDPAFEQLLFSTYFGGAGELGPLLYGGVNGLAVDSQGVIWIAGASPSEQLPAPEGTPLLGQNYLAGLSQDGSTLSALFTAPSGIAGLGVFLGANGVTSLGSTGALLTASPGQGPSLVSIANSAGSSITNAVAPYELISLYGLNIGPPAPVNTQVVKGVVTDSLGGVQVLFDGTPAPLLYVGPTQINAIVPREVSADDTASIQIVTPTGSISGPTMQVSPSQPGVVPSSAQGPALILPYAAAVNQDGSINSASNPAALGSVVSVWVSGAGASTQRLPDGAIVTLADSGSPALPVVAFSAPAFVIGTLPGPLSLEVVYAGDAAGMVAGVTQVNFLLPSQAEYGLDNVAFWLQIGGASSELFTLFLQSPQ